MQDVICIGIGPSNLSVAALLKDKADLKLALFDSKKEFYWHKGLIFEESCLNVSFLKDLVTLADPTNKFSYLNFLHSTGRIYKKINAQFDALRLKEFEQYLNWVSSDLPCHFGHKITDIQFKNGAFSVYTKDIVKQTKNIVLGIGLKPFLSKKFTPLIGRNFFHGVSYLNQNLNLKGKRVAIVGGGQTSAEIFNHIISDKDKLPSKLYWISKRANFLPLDDSTFVNEWYTPNYSKNFYDYDASVKKEILKPQKLSSDGIHLSLLKKIYQKLYCLEFLSGVPKFWDLRVNAEMKEASKNIQQENFNIKIQNVLDGSSNLANVDVVILCTGFRNHIPDFMKSIKHKVKINDGVFDLNCDFSLKWEGPEDRKIFVQNNAVKCMGIADPNLSLVAWRGAKIANSILNTERYKMNFSDSLINWRHNENQEQIQNPPKKMSYENR